MSSMSARTGHELAVRSGGHSGPGFGTTDDGIVLDLSDLKCIAIDVEQQTVWAGTGLTAGELTRAVGEHDLAIGFGDSGSVGIGGITLGGGIGYLVRKFGLTIDNVLAAEVVTADGRTVRADAHTNPDLFWAIRGGGGNFGIVTRFKYRLHTLPRVVAGTLMLPATAEIIAGFAAAAEAAPDELSTIVNVMPAPPMPSVPAEHQGRLVVMAQMTYAGDPADADAALAPFRALATPIVDDLRPMVYADLFAAKPKSRSTMSAAGQTLFTDAIDVTAARRILARLTSGEAPMRVVHFRVLGGAMGRVATDATAFAHRQSRIIVNVAASYAGDDERVSSQAWVDAVAADLRGAEFGRIRQFPRRRGPGPGSRRVSRTHMGSAGRHQAALGPHQPLPTEPEHRPAQPPLNGAAPGGLHVVCTRTRRQSADWAGLTAHCDRMHGQARSRPTSIRGVSPAGALHESPDRGRHRCPAPHPGEDPRVSRP